MKTSAWISGAALFACFVAISGCGAGTYQIPNVEPVVKPKPEDDLLDSISGNDTDKSSSSSSDSADKPAEPEPTKAAPEPAKATESPKGTEAKVPKSAPSSKK